MNDKFDSPRCRAVAAGELAKGLAQSVTRRGALKKFGVGVAGIALATLGITNKAEARSSRCINECRQSCSKVYKRGTPEWDYCFWSCANNCAFGI
jgi:hypothetical protein